MWDRCNVQQCWVPAIRARRGTTWFISQIRRSTGELGGRRFESDRLEGRSEGFGRRGLVERGEDGMSAADSNPRGVASQKVFEHTIPLSAAVDRLALPHQV